MKKWLLWAVQILVAIILLHTLFYKFSAHPNSVALFSELGMEPVGRIGVGIVELIAGIALLTPLAAVGAVLSLALMIGAVIAHFTVLGVTGAQGPLFGMAVVALLGSIFILWVRRKELPLIGETF